MNVFHLDKHRSDHDRVEKVRKRERHSSDDEDRSPSPPPTKSKANEASSSAREGGEHMSLSVEETNKLRASLGLKPLSTDTGGTGDADGSGKSLNSDENFVHQPAVDVSEKNRSEKLKEKLGLQKEKRLLQGKFLYVVYSNRYHLS